MCTEHHETSPPSINGSGPREVALGRPQNSEREASGILGQVDVNDGDTVTVLECQAPTILAKRWCSDGEIQGYSKAKNLKPHACPVANIRELSALLAQLERNRLACIVRGAFVGFNSAEWRAAQAGWSDAGDLKPGCTFRRDEVFVDAPLHTVLIEVDEFEPLLSDPVAEPVEAINEFIATGLPPEFHGISYHWQLSNSAGHVKNAGRLKGHIWYWLSEPRNSAELKAWAEAVQLPADRAVFQKIQVHYTAAPVFEPGVEDPVPLRSGFVEGMLGDAVELNLDAAIEATAAIEQARKPTRAQRLSAAAERDPIVAVLDERGMLKGGQNRDGGFHIECPNSAEHTSDTGDSATLYYPANTGGFRYGAFDCKHAHCRELNRVDFLRLLGADDAAGGFQSGGYELRLVAPVAIDVATWTHTEPKRPEFLIPDWLQRGEIALLAGHGGSGKSWLLLTACVCLALGVDFFGMPTERRRVALFSFEDSASVLQWRVSRVAAVLGVNVADLAGWLGVYDGTKSDAALVVDSHGRLEPTATYKWLAEEMAATGAEVLAIDGVSDVYDASENNRSQVKGFLRFVRRLYPEHGAALLLAHVNRATASGAEVSEGYSGSTGWHNGVRNRWYLKPESDADTKTRTGVVVLQLQKANNARTGAEVRLRWSDEHEAFVQVVEYGQAQSTADADAAERAFIVDAIREGHARGEPVPAAMGGSRTAVVVLQARRDLPDRLRGEAGKRRLKRHLEVLRGEGAIRVGEHRKANRQKVEVFHAG